MTESSRLNGEQIKIDSCQDSNALLRNNVDSGAYAQRRRPIMWQKERKRRRDGGWAFNINAGDWDCKT